jgi:hypothetical protein
MEIIRLQDRHMSLPVFGNGSDIQKGALLSRGATPATNNGMLILSANPAVDAIGTLEELHDYSVSGDTLINGTSFVTRSVSLYTQFPLFRAEFSQDSADLITCTQAVTTTTMTVGSLEDNIDGAFIYVVSGTGAGQTNYLTASAAGSCTLKAAFATSLDTTSKFIKIIPRFHKLAVFNSAVTKLSSTAAAGSTPVLVLDILIDSPQIANGPVSLDPTKHAALVLDTARSHKFYADFALIGTSAGLID